VIGRYINQTVAFYVEQSDADNHAVREAACACIAELAQKIDRDALVRCVVSSRLHACPV
jgi:hypothetical protein